MKKQLAVSFKYPASSSFHNCSDNSVPFLVKWSELLSVPLLISQHVAVRLHTALPEHLHHPPTSDRVFRVRGGTALLAFNKD